MAGRNVAELQLQLQTITAEEPSISLARVVERAKLKARQDKEYSDLKQRHAKELSDAEAGRMPAKHATPAGMHVTADQ
jgi:hypothetical protein